MRKQSQNKPYWKRPTPKGPAYVREYAYEENGKPALDENGERIWRDRPNRAMKRAFAAQLRREMKKYGE